MTQDTFKALVLTQQDKDTRYAFQNLTLDALPEGDVLVDVAYSSLNYKDGLAVTGKGKVVRKFPMVPGIDFAGVVAKSDSKNFKVGDEVVLTGWGVGESHWGGFAQKARVNSEWLTRLPRGLDLEQAMAIGTAGFTAMLSVMALEDRGLKPGDGPVVVTGAAGGVGSIAVALLAKLGYTITAPTGRAELRDYLETLGASEFIDRHDLGREANPLEKETWAGAIDTVGGQTLATVLSQMQYGGTVTACGLVGGTALETTVFPFILRGVALLGIDSVMCEAKRRKRAWSRLAADLAPDHLSKMTHKIGLSEIPRLADSILKGQVRGRVVVDVNATPS